MTPNEHSTELTVEMLDDAIAEVDDCESNEESIAQIPIKTLIALIDAARKGIMVQKIMIHNEEGCHGEYEIKPEYRQIK